MGLLREAGLDATDRPNAADAIPSVQRLRGHPAPTVLVGSDPRYGQVVCVCEQVSAAEIAAALSSLVPAHSIDGVRKRTRATYRPDCQGAICAAGVAFMCSLATNEPPQLIETVDRGPLRGESMTKIAVVGAGLTGLAAAATLASRYEVVLVERLPAIGGLAGWENATARRLDGIGRAAGVLQLLGTTALRWEAGRLGSISRARIDSLGGGRPSRVRRRCPPSYSRGAPACRRPPGRNHLRDRGRAPRRRPCGPGASTRDRGCLSLGGVGRPEASLG